MKYVKVFLSIFFGLLGFVLSLIAMAHLFDTKHTILGMLCLLLYVSAGFTTLFYFKDKDF